MRTRSKFPLPEAESADYIIISDEDDRSSQEPTVPKVSRKRRRARNINGRLDVVQAKNDCRTAAQSHLKHPSKPNGRHISDRLISDKSSSESSPDESRTIVIRPNPKRPKLDPFKSKIPAKIDAPNFSSAPTIDPSKIKKVAKSVKLDSKTNQTASIELYRRNKDIFLYAIDLNKKLYAIKILSSPFNGNASTFDEYLTKSLQDAVQLYERLALGACNIMRYPQITEVETTAFSSIIMQQKMELLKFEITVQKFHVREQKLRNFSIEITKTLKDNKLLECIRALDRLCVYMREWIPKLIFKKQPRIVCILFDLINQQDAISPQWNYIKRIAELIILSIQKLFQFNGSDKDFMDWFLMEIELYTELTAHLSEREKFELIVDPVEKIELAPPSRSWM